MDEIPDNSARVTVASLDQLRELLASRGVPIQEWGTGGAKRVEDLWIELGTGESVLTDPPLERRVSFVSVLIRRGDKSLTEVAQLLATGKIRKRRWPPGEKMLPDEDFETAAFRCLEEELGIPRESCRIVPGTYDKGARTGESLSYPGLVTRYAMHEVGMEVPNLPETAFETEEAADSGDVAVTKHFWDWI